MRKAVAELWGTGMLTFAIVSSGVHAETLSDDQAITLGINAAVTAAILGLLIFALLPLSGAHLNPAVTLALVIRGQIPVSQAGAYASAQTLGAIAGASLGHLLFQAGTPVISSHDRASALTLTAEFLATAGLVALILLAVETGRRSSLPWLVAVWIGAGYFMWPSTGFANPAVTVGRMFTDTFTGVSPASGALFIAVQLAGAIAGLLVARALMASRGAPAQSRQSALPG